MTTPALVPSAAIADAMKVGAESAGVRAIIGGLDGAGWAAKCRILPMCTLPPGAGALVVKHFGEQRPIEALNHLRAARGVAHEMAECDGRRLILNAIDAAMNLLDVNGSAPVSLASSTAAAPAPSSGEQYYAHRLAKMGEPL